MGRAKEMLQEMEERKFSYINSKNLCRSCLEDSESFKPFFRKYGKPGKCSYCNRQKSVLDINDLIDFISEKVFIYYTNPAEVLPYESAEGGYLGGEMWDIGEILDNHISFIDNEVRNDLLSAFDQCEQYCKSDPFSDSESEVFKSFWDQFVHLVKYEKRFFFPRPAKERVPTIRKGKVEYAGDVLNFAYNEMKSQELFRTLHPSETIFRAREIDPLLNDTNNSLEYIIPPLEVASKYSSRLSPAGIPIFYGAYSKEHLVSEIRAKNPQNIYIAEFELKKSIIVLDLTKFKGPSIFIDEPTQYEGKRFIRSFISDIMTPVSHDGREHVEYVPSQVFSEFIRHRVEHREKKVSGIIFPSSFNGTSKNIALYINNSAIDYKESCKSDSILSLKKISQHVPI